MRKTVLLNGLSRFWGALGAGLLAALGAGLLAALGAGLATSPKPPTAGLPDS